MGPVIAYLLTVIALPALGAAAIAAALLRTPWGRSQRFASSAAGAAVAVAVLWAFLAELDPYALLRQFPIALPDDEAPFERWHRVGLAALALVALAPAFAWATASDVARTPRLAWAREAAVALLAVAVIAGFSRGFPGAGWMDTLIGALPSAGLGWLLSRRSATMGLGTTAAWAASIAALAGATGFPSLAAISAAMSLACALLAWVLRPARTKARTPGFAVAAMAGVLLACGRAYADESVPAWTWWATLALPAGACLAAVAAGARKAAR